MGDLTRHFDLSEFRQKDPPVAVPANLVPNVQHLARQLDELRDVLGAITINSCYRTQAKNDSLSGAAKYSQHLDAKAADIVIPGVTKAQVYCTILRLIREGKMEKGGLGWYGARGHTHYDVRGSMSPFNKSNEPVPDCSDITKPTPPPDPEREAVMLKAVGEDQVYVTDFIVKAPVKDPQHRDQLLYSGVQGPIDVDQDYIDAIQDA